MTKLEEIARVIDPERWGYADRGFYSPAAKLMFKAEAFAQACAAVEALLEPSEAMMDAGKPWAIGKAPPNCWVRMIDAILNENTE